VSAISRSTAAAVQKIVAREVAVVPYGSALTDDGTPVSRPAFFSPGEPLRLLFVGRLVQRKGVEILVQALARVRRHRLAELTVVGEGEWEPRIRETASALGLTEHVHFTGRVTSERLAREYQESDIFVLPAVVDSRGDTEGLGVVLLEALRYERPVVASAVGGIVDIVEDGRSGWLVPPGDPDRLADTLLQVADRLREARSIGAYGRAMVRERFSWSRILDATEAVYESARERRHGRPT
jgi:glycosyltransferase involved in cell wall biosynthesis